MLKKLSFNFSEHLKTFSWGMPVHAGWGLGLDRFVMFLTGMKKLSFNE
ncbi:MAG: amino acid--tRNA ligase-related protein [Nitrososphaerales archaeon]